MQESDDDLDPLVSSGIIFLCIVCGQLIVTTVIIGIVVTLYRSGHIFACFIGKRFQIIKFSRKIQRCKILKSAVQLIQITEKFIGGIFGCRVYVVDLGIYIGDLGTKRIYFLLKLCQRRILSAGGKRKCGQQSGRKGKYFFLQNYILQII